MFKVEVQSHVETIPLPDEFATREDVTKWVETQDEILETWLNSEESGKDGAQPPAELRINEGSHIVVQDTETGERWNIAEPDNWESMA